MNLKVVSNKSPWLAGAELGGIYTNPVSHGEGRFVAPKEWIDKLFANGQVAMVSTGEVAWLRALMSTTFDSLMDEQIDPHTAAFLLGLSHVWAATHTDQRLRAMEFMLGR